jgi:hypothetical protein
MYTRTRGARVRITKTHTHKLTHTHTHTHTSTILLHDSQRADAQRACVYKYVRMQMLKELSINRTGLLRAQKLEYE